MNTHNAGSGAGGGEVLQYVGQGNNQRPSLLDEQVMQQFMMIPAVKIIIMVLIMIIAAIIIFKILEIKNPLKGRAITNELDYLDKVSKRDNSILRANKIMSTITNIIERGPFSLGVGSEDYIAYNLERANIRIPGKVRVMKPQEFNACIKIVQIFLVFISVMLMLFINAPIGVLIICMTITMGNVLPMQFVRQIVKAKDSEIIENFADLYLMVHYSLLASAGAPIISSLRSYDKTTVSEEMHRFVDVCEHYMETYGEYDATRFIAKQYREIPQVGKLMRLIRQANEGGDVRAELVGFRNELIAAKKYEINKHGERVIAKAKASFNILIPILIQAIISAMAIYVEDLKLTSTFM